MFILTSDVLRCLEALGNSNGRLRVDTLSFRLFQFAILQCLIKSVAQGGLPSGFISLEFDNLVSEKQLEADLYISWLSVYLSLQI